MNVNNSTETYITKPFNLEQLIILIEKLLSDQYLLLLKEKERLDNERDMMLSSIKSLINALEERDPYTRGHSDEVSKIVRGMAEIMGMTQEEIEIISIGAELHDIGKIGIRDAILLKQGSLTNEEYSQIKQLTEIGAFILEPILSLSRAIPIVRDHHERFDGTGYPNGLKGDEIHFWVRMTAVADIYHALISNRPYCKGKSKKQALEIIKEYSGNQLCPKAIHIFSPCIKNTDEYHLQSKETEDRVRKTM